MRRNRTGNGDWAVAAVLICIVLCLGVNCGVPVSEGTMQKRIEADVEIHKIELEKAKVELERERLRGRATTAPVGVHK